ncbi:MAG: hypothetical protein U5K28_08760 [Halobacteriales archaeon]|nr:hypothetical protein [Halobacteriales archaeon]
MESAFASSDGYLTVQRDDGGEPGEIIGVAPVRSRTYLVDIRVDIDEQVVG